jgi:pSer/pThr/pTyr-binding forkhead associated (FHA) protein
MGADPIVPRPGTARELQAVVHAERAGRPFLLFRDGHEIQQLQVLDDATPFLTIGRGERNAVRIDWDREVSGVHAELRPAGGEWTIADDGLSSNGTFVNGSRLGSRQRLRDGDQLRVGRTILLYRAPTASPTPGTVKAGDTPTVERLSDTQRKVLIALCRPYRDGVRGQMPATNQSIADELCLSLDAVKNHLRVLFAKFDLETVPQNDKRIQLAETALRWGLVTPRDL